MFIQICYHCSLSIHKHSDIHCGLKFFFTILSNVDQNGLVLYYVKLNCVPHPVSVAECLLRDLRPHKQLRHRCLFLVLLVANSMYLFNATRRTRVEYMAFGSPRYRRRWENDPPPPPPKSNALVTRWNGTYCEEITLRANTTWEMAQGRQWDRPGPNNRLGGNLGTATVPPEKLPHVCVPVVTIGFRLNVPVTIATRWKWRLSLLQRVRLRCEY